jgi:hypothetical protein
MGPEFVLAQGAPDIFAEYLKLGVLGLTAAAAIFWAVSKDRELSREKKERLEDAMRAIDLAKVSAETMTKWTITQENQNKAMSDMARALERLVVK